MTSAAVLREDGAPGKAAGAVAVVIPTLDEEQSIADVVRSLPRAIVSRVIVADGGSRDATAARAQAAGAEVIDAGPGYGRACLAATMAAGDADIIVFMDGDGADDADSIGRLVEPIRSGRYDFVIASRARGNREPGSIAWHQLAAGRLAGWGMRLLYGVRYTDMCALRAIRRNALLQLGMRELTYGWNLEMQMRAARAGLRILEIPADYHRRRGGKRGRGFLVANEGPSHCLHLQCRPRPLHHRDRDRPIGTGADRLQHARMPERSDIAAFLQIEADLIHAARRVDGEHELKIGCGLRRRARGAREQCDQCQRDGASHLKLKCDDCVCAESFRWKRG